MNVCSVQVAGFFSGVFKELVPDGKALLTMKKEDVCMHACGRVDDSSL